MLINKPIWPQSRFYIGPTTIDSTFLSAKPDNGMNCLATFSSKLNTTLKDKPNVFL